MPPSPARAPRPARLPQAGRAWSATSAPATPCRPASTSARRTTSRSAYLRRRRARRAAGRGPALAGAVARGAPRPIAPGRRRRAVHLRRGPDRRPARGHRRRRVRGPAARRRPAGSSRTPSSPTSSATPSAGPRSPRPSTATGRRSTRSSASLARAQARLAAAGSSATRRRSSRTVTELLAAWLPLYQEIEPRVQTIIERDVDLRADDRATLGPARPHRADDQRHPLAVRAGRPPRRPRPVVPRPPVQLHVQRAATGGCSSTRSPTPRSSRTTRSPRRVGVLRLHRALGDETPAPDPAPAQGPRLVPDRDRRAARAVQADDQAPPRPAPGRRPRDADRGGRAVLLQPPPRPARRRVGRAQALPGLRPPMHVRVSHARRVRWRTNTREIADDTDSTETMQGLRRIRAHDQALHQNDIHDLVQRPHPRPVRSSHRAARDPAPTRPTRCEPRHPDALDDRQAPDLDRQRRLRPHVSGTHA